jgi:tRNA A37 threonylcarbamoyladenosine modification protein TsaB
VVIDARRGNVFSAVYNIDNNFECTVEPKMRKIEDFIELCNGVEPINTKTMKIDPLKLNKTLVEDVHTFTPNYLREWGE